MSTSCRAGKPLRVDIALLLSLYAEGCPYSVMTARLACSASTITYHIRRAHVLHGVPFRPRQSSSAHARGTLLLGQGWRQSDVAREVGVSRQRVHQWVQDGRGQKGEA